MSTNLHPIDRAVRVLVHCFARPRVEWQQIDGGKWKSSGGRVLSDASYQKVQAKLKGKGGAKEAKGTVPAAKAKTEPAGKPGTVKNVYGQDIPAEAGALPGEPGHKPPRPPKSKPAKAPVPESSKLPAAPPPLGTGLSAAPPAPSPPPKPPTLPKGMPAPPPPTPADMAYIDANHKKDVGRFGKKVADTLRSALSYAVGMLTATNGLAWGALAGAALGGPLGLAVGTGVGGSIGGFLSPIVQRKTLRSLGGRPQRDDNRFFAEPAAAPNAPADLDPVALLTCRLKAALARQGKPTDTVSDKTVMAALAMAAMTQEQEEKGAQLATMGEGVRTLVRTARKLCGKKKVRRFAGKSGSGIAPFVPNLSRQRGAGLLAFLG